MAKSYFAILGITPRASADDIRSAYRRLAKEYHPDRYEGGSQKFREVQEAYSVLGNQRKRNEYESLIQKASSMGRITRPSRPEPEPLIPEQHPADIGDI